MQGSLNSEKGIMSKIGEISFGETGKEGFDEMMNETGEGFGEIMKYETCCLKYNSKFVLLK